MSSDGSYVDTGVEEKRRRLTLEEALSGKLPAQFTTKEWKAMLEESKRLSD